MLKKIFRTLNLTQSFWIELTEINQIYEKETKPKKAYSKVFFEFNSQNVVTMKLKVINSPNRKQSK